MMFIIHIYKRLQYSLKGFDEPSDHEAQENTFAIGHVDSVHRVS